MRAYFSIEEAETLLPSLSQLVVRAQQLKEKLERYERIELRRPLMTDGTTGLPDLGETYDGQLCSLKESFYEVVERIESLGGVFRDVEEGFVDFYSRFEGRDIFLSWKAGERKIRFWREVEAEGRKKIVEVR